MLMKGYLVLVLSVGLALAADPSNILDENRKCPDGFFYAGEPSFDQLERGRAELWEKGPKSPIYSCYKFVEDARSFANGSISCNDLQGQLISVNDVLEVDILTSDLFTDSFSDEMQSNLTINGETFEVWTSGINLGNDEWTWLGTDEVIEDEIIKSLNVSSTGQAANCIVISWKSEVNSTSLVYSAVPCTEVYTTALCEVKVYTQYWYVWFYTNWLQILFFFTMGVLLLSTCCMFQALFLRRSSTVTRRPVLHAAPPPYTPNPVNHHTTTTSTAQKYAQKGKDILAKVTFYKPSAEDKVRLHDTNA